MRDSAWGVAAVMHQGQVLVSEDAMAAAIAKQFPALADLDIATVPSAGTVIAPFRVGKALLARLPLVPVRGQGVLDRLQSEGRHARALRGLLPIQVPALVGIGQPFPDYDGVWSMWTWVDGDSLDRVLDRAPASSCDLDALAVDLARVLRAQQSLPTNSLSWSGNGRGGRPLTDTEWVRTSIDRGAHLVDVSAATRVWDRALQAPAYPGPPMSINGDPGPGNFLMTDGRLSGVIDVSAPVVGDPASDLQPAWQVFDEPQRCAFRQAMASGDADWERGRGWAFEQAIGGLHYYEHTNPLFFRLARRTLERLLDTS